FALADLLREQLEWHRRRGRPADLAAYEREFPGFAALVRCAFIEDAASAFEDGRRAAGGGRAAGPSLEWVLAGFPPELRGELVERLLPLELQRQGGLGRPGDLAACWGRFRADRACVATLCGHFGLPVPGSRWGDYDLGDVEGIGGMGVVYVAFHRP